MSRDYRDERGGHKYPPRKLSPGCGCCSGKETYRRKDGGHLRRTSRESQSLKQEFSAEDD